MKWLIGAIYGLSPEVQSPVDECTRVTIYIGVLDNHSPCSDARLAPISLVFCSRRRARRGLPVCNGHELPICIARSMLVRHPGRAQITDHATWADEVHAEIPTAGVIDIDSDCDVL